MSNFTITFLMPEVASLPMGGYKVLFEHANRFVRDGYQICFVLPTSLIVNDATTKKVIQKWLRFFLYYFIKNFRPTGWFKIEKGVKFKLVPSLAQVYIPKSKIYVATALQTAYYLNDYKTIAAKLYFIQGYEYWGMGYEKLHESYHFDMTKIVVSNYLKSIVEQYSERVIVIPNGFDFEQFKAFIPYQQRNRYHICTMYHPEPLKGFLDTIKAIEIVKQKYTQIKLYVFGTILKKFDQDYIEYVQNPSTDILCELYNNSSIFVGASHSEGWGLTVGEAMACSCAIVCTDTGGYLEMAKNNITALVSHVGNIEDLANNIIRLIEDDTLRMTIAKNGNESIQSYTWEKSYELFKAEILKCQS